MDILIQYVYFHGMPIMTAGICILHGCVRKAFLDLLFYVRNMIFFFNDKKKGRRYIFGVVSIFMT